MLEKTQKEHEEEARTRAAERSSEMNTEKHTLTSQDGGPWIPWGEPPHCNSEMVGEGKTRDKEVDAVLIPQ